MLFSSMVFYDILWYSMQVLLCNVAGPNETVSSWKAAWTGQNIFLGLCKNHGLPGCRYPASMLPRRFASQACSAPCQTTLCKNLQETTILIERWSNASWESWVMSWHFVWLRCTSMDNQCEHPQALITSSAQWPVLVPMVPLGSEQHSVVVPWPFTDGATRCAQRNSKLQ